MNRIAFDNEKEIRLKSLLGAAGINALLLLLLFFINLSHTVPDPPPIEFIEVNFGTDARGSGKIQTRNRASDLPNPVDARSSDSKRKETPAPRVVPTRAMTAPPVEKVKPAKTIAEKPIIASRSESPVTAPERPEPKRTVPIKTPAPAERPTPPAPSPPKKVETVNNDALFKKSTGGAGSGSTAGKAAGTGASTPGASTPGGNNNGDDASGVGDKGNPNGRINAKEFYGTPGGSSSGVAFDVSGWSMAGKPSVNDDSDETGKIVFKITVDQSGEITNVRQVQSTVSPSVSELYRRAVRQLRLRPKSGATPPTSTGTITFIIKSKD